MEITLENYQNLLLQVQKTIKQVEENLVKSVNQQKVILSWEIGKKIDRHLVRETKNNDNSYGKKLFEQLEKDTGIQARTLYQMHAFYKTYPKLPSSNKSLTWSHYRSLVSVKSETKRQLLEDFTLQNNLSADGLQQKISKNNSRKKGREKVAPKKLKVTRGQLFTYKISALVDSKKTFVDLGFNMFFELKTALKFGEIIESKKSAEKISLKKSTVNTLQMHTYKAWVERVVDGDTLHVILDLGFKMQHREILRLAKINAPEIATKSGKKAAAVLQEILQDVPFLIVKTNKTDIYGRYVADVFFDENKKETDPQKVADCGTYLNQLLLDREVVMLF